MLAIPAAAAETADEEAPARLGPAAYWGTVTWMDEDTFLLDSGKEDGLGDAVVVHVGDAPYLDAVTGNTLNLETLEDGDAVYAWVGPAMALSLPPQSTASLIVGNIPADYAGPVLDGAARHSSRSRLRRRDRRGDRRLPAFRAGLLGTGVALAVGEG